MQITTPAASVSSVGLSYLGQFESGNTDWSPRQLPDSWALWPRRWELVGRREYYTPKQANGSETEVLQGFVSYLISNSRPMEKIIADAITREFWNLL